MDWMMIEGEELARLKLRLDDAVVAKSERLEAARMPLPFYRNGSLVQIVSEFGSEIARGCLVETGEGVLVPLDGSRAQIDAANEMAGLNLNIGNVITYAMFFCQFLLAADGETFPFVTKRGPWSLDTGRMPKDLKPRVKMMADGSGRYRINAYISHAEMMFAALFEVRNDGVVDMIDEEPLGRIVPLQ